MIGADDKSRIWLNGKQLFEERGEHSAFPDAHAAPAVLAAGWNTLLTRVTNITGDHVLYLRMSNKPKDLARAGNG